MYVKDSKKNEVYVFRNYDEYKDYFLMYLDSIEEDVIDLAIYTRGSKGQIIALKELCEHIIVKKKIPSHRFDAADIFHDFWPFCRCCKESGGRFCHSHLSGAAGYAGDQYRFCSNRRMPVYGCAAGKYAYGRNDPCSKPCILPGQAFS